jgi:hypothetical protein
MKQYKDFNSWFHEVENYGMRSERFYEEFQDMTPQRAIEWLRAVWECARNDEVRAKFDEECG